MIMQLFLTFALTLVVCSLLCLLSIDTKKVSSQQAILVKLSIVVWVICFWGMVGCLFAFIWR